MPDGVIDDELLRKWPRRDVNKPRAKEFSSINETGVESQNVLQPNPSTSMHFIEMGFERYPETCSWNRSFSPAFIGKESKCNLTAGLM